MILPVTAQIYVLRTEEENNSQINGSRDLTGKRMQMHPLQDKANGFDKTELAQVVARSFGLVLKLDDFEVC
jgi:extradiol dioxygenase family protein